MRADQFLAAFPLCPLRRMLAEVVEASWQVPNQPKQHLHRLGLRVSAGLPARDRVGPQMQQAAELALGKAEALANVANLPCRQQAVLRAVDGSRVLLEPSRVLEAQNDLAAFWAPEVKGGGYGYLLPVQGEAEPRAPFNHAGAARRTRIVRKRALRWSVRCSWPMGLVHLTLYHYLVNYAYGESASSSQNGASETLVAPPKPNDFHHLRHAYIHLFTMAVCRNSGYVPGTTVAHHRSAPPSGRTTVAAAAGSA